MRCVRRRAGCARSYCATARELQRQKLQTRGVRFGGRICIAAPLGRWTQHRHLQLYLSATPGSAFGLNWSSKLLGLIRELDAQTRDYFSLLLLVRSGHFHRVYTARGKIAAETKCDAGQKSSLDAAQLDSGMTLLRRVYDWR